MALEIKICGLSTNDSIDWARGAGAGTIGLVHFPRSPRHVDLDAMATLAAHARRAAPDLAVEPARVVALTVDADDDLLAAIMAAAAPDVLQLHGHEDLARARAIESRFGVPVLKALGIADAADVGVAREWSKAGIRLLLDAKPPKEATRPGGLGRTFDWSLLTALDHDRSFMLSGGLDPDNVAEAVRLLRPGGVDVSSGVETAPGIKSRNRIAAFVAAARAADEEGAAAAAGRQRKDIEA
ncbi:phosphoribosylanthranilate isomerase [Methylobrevis pamukkalensis]|uniref:N-(5'-phosphoribosyl)anthranilate isomerase n=1 Tax=Methylobrevis pamukkalensis TaxID=1439726 RepID=A0A1E3H4R0_9HYPH|nr:phosphoribosylanthranilate isomerase [Methylobrevis pamukkalensis]ODN71313.1 N-(5'-phosphoribosyl)anthranilate isomerase [Methylobrevis pamukkalensis]